MKAARLLSLLSAVLLTGCVAQTADPTAQSGTATQGAAAGTQSPTASPTPSALPLGSAVPASSFPEGSGVCNDSLTDSNPLNIATATLRSDGKTLTVLVTLDSPYPVHTGRVFTVTLGRAQHQADYTVSIAQLTTGGATASVTDSQDGHTTQAPGAQASISDRLVSAQIPASYFPRLSGHFLWKVEASANGNSDDACPNENSAGVRVWLDFPAS
jgi:hypothetical protein